MSRASTSWSRVLAVTMVVASTVVLPGCGRSTDAGSTTAATSQPGAGWAPSTEPAPIVTTPPAIALPRKVQTAALLPASAIPQGKQAWQRTFGPVDAAMAGITMDLDWRAGDPECVKIADGIAVDVASGVIRRVDAPKLHLTEAVESFASRVAAAEVMSKTLDLLGECETATVTFDGRRATLTQAPLVLDMGSSGAERIVRSVLIRTVEGKRYHYLLAQERVGSDVAFLLVNTSHEAVDNIGYVEPTMSRFRDTVEQYRAAAPRSTS